MKTLRLALLIIALHALSAAESRAWVSGGVPVSNAMDDQDDADALPDGAGGVYIAWTDRRDPTTGPDVYVQRLAPDGSPLWAIDGIAVCNDAGKQEFPRVVTDNAGGIIVAWYDDRTAGTGVRLQRINSSGVRLWATSGVELFTDPASLGPPLYDITGDGVTGAIVSWTDGRNGLDLDVIAQRVDGTGAKMWEVDGVKVASGPGAQYAQAIVTDGVAGAIMVWVDDAGTDQDLYVQRVSAGGFRQWGEFGHALCTAVRDQTGCRMVPDGAGGAIAAWVDYRSNPSPVFDPSYADIIAQRVEWSGVMLWGADGIPIANVSGAQKNVVMVPNGVNGAYIAFEDHRHGFTSDIYIQNVDVFGTAWSPDGIAMCRVVEDQISPSITADDAGGAVVSWTDRRMGESDVYAQRITYTGERIWTWGGVPVCEVSGDQGQSVAVMTITREIVVAWTDSRGADEDVYAMSPIDTLGTPTVVRGTRPLPISIRGQYPNPFTTEFRLDFELDAAADVAIELFDVNGRRASRSSLGYLGLGVHTASVSAIDESGRPLPSGVYFFRLRAGDAYVTRKVAVVR